MIIEENILPKERKDGRGMKEMQEIFIQKGAKRDSTSSVYLETNHLKMMISINGPIYQSTIPKSKGDDAGKMSVMFKIQIPSYYNDVNLPFNKNWIETQLEELFTKNIFIEKYARTKLTINVEVFEFSCDFLPFAVMGVTLALNDANIEQKGLITCANIICNKMDSIIVDPTFDEEAQAVFKLTFASTMDFQENNLFVQRGVIEESEFKKVIGTAIKMCEAYQNFLISKL